MTLLYRLARPDDYRAYAPAEYCICAALGHVAERDGVVVAISLVTWDLRGRAWAWLDANERLPAIVMHRRALEMLAILRAVEAAMAADAIKRGEQPTINPMLHAFCSQTIPGAEKWLDRLGFHPAPELTTDPDHPVWLCPL